MRALVFLVALLFWPYSVWAGIWATGNDFLETCDNVKNSKNYFSKGFCGGYISGHMERKYLDEALIETIDPKYCLLPDIPDKVTVGQALDVVVNWLRRHPERRHESVKFLVFYALAEAFPCPKN